MRQRVGVCGVSQHEGDSESDAPGGRFAYFRSVTQPTRAALDKMIRRRLRAP